MSLSPHWVKSPRLTTTDTEKDPGIHSQAESESKGDVDESTGIRDLTKGVVVSGLPTLSSSVSDLGCSVGEEEKEDCEEVSSRIVMIKANE